MQHLSNPSPAAGRNAGRLGALPFLVLIGSLGFLAACDSLVQVAAPSRVIAEGLFVPANAVLLTNSAQADFECALAGYAVAGGMVGNELEVGTTLIVMKEYDKRDFKTFGSIYTESTCESQGAPGVYKPLSVARFQADTLARLLQAWTDEEVPDRQTLLARAASYAGYAYVLMGEGMCSAAFDLGPEQTPAEIFQAAETRFGTAIAAAQAAGNQNLLALARVGRARARLRLAKAADAAADAQGVPAGFRYDASYDATSPRRRNAVSANLDLFQDITVDTSYRRRNDPRVDAYDTGRKASDGVTDLWSTHKYTGVDAPIAIATWEEAQLIQAEAVGGQAAVGIINTLRSKVGLPPFNSTDPTQIKAQIVEERQMQFFLDGHHLGDIRQYGIPLSPPAGYPFKDGGGTYVDQKCFPLPDNERLNNPYIH